MKESTFFSPYFFLKIRMVSFHDVDTDSVWNTLNPLVAVCLPAHAPGPALIVVSQPIKSFDSNWLYPSSSHLRMVSLPCLVLGYTINKGGYMWHLCLFCMVVFSEQFDEQIFLIVIWYFLFFYLKYAILQFKDSLWLLISIEQSHSTEWIVLWVSL